MRSVCAEGQRVSTMKSVPLPVSEPSPLSEMMSEAPGDISSEIRSSVSGVMDHQDETPAPPTVTPAQSAPVEQQVNDTTQA